MSSVTGTTIQRRRILVQGIVQGVGFRPFVYGQAQRRGLVGFVLNNSQGVTIEVEGSLNDLDSFQQALREQAPPLARIDSVITELVPPRYEDSFSIAYSQKVLSGRRSSRLIVPSVKTVCANCSIQLTDVIVIRLSTVPTADPVSLSYRMFLMIVKRQPCRYFQCARSVKGNTRIHSIDAFTPNPTPAPFVAHRCAFSIRHHLLPKPT